MGPVGKRIWSFCLWGSGVIGGLIVAAAQVSFDEASSNIASWLKAVGVADVPAVFSSASTDGYATLIGVVLLLVTAGAAAAHLIGRKRRQNIPAIPAGSVVDKSELIALPEAAQLLYEHARKKAPSYARMSESASGSHLTNGSPDEILDWMAMYISERVRVFGCRPPSAKPELIENKHGEFEDGALIYKTHNQTYNTLSVRRHDLQSVISMMDET